MDNPFKIFYKQNTHYAKIYFRMDYLQASNFLQFSLTQPETGYSVKSKLSLSKNKRYIYFRINFLENYTLYLYIGYCYVQCLLYVHLYSKQLLPRHFDFAKLQLFHNGMQFPLNLHPTSFLGQNKELRCHQVVLLKSKKNS